MTEVVNPPVTEEKSTPVVEPTVVVAPPEVPEKKPGDKTDPALLLKSLQEEREKRRIAEEALAKAQQPEVLSEEGQILKKEITTLEQKLAERDRIDAMNALHSAHPVLKDKAAEFQEFLTANEGMKLETAAKAFMVENDLIEAPATRKGLEKPSGGNRAPQTVGLTPAEVDDLRNNNYRKYVAMLKNGEIKF